jgi:hypothetical protein
MFAPMKALPIILDLYQHFTSKGYHCSNINSKTLILSENDSYPRLIFVADMETNIITVMTDPKRLLVEIKATDKNQLLTKLFKLGNLKENFRSWMQQPTILSND